MSSSIRDPSHRLALLLVLDQHTYQDLQRHELFQMCDHLQQVQLSLHHSSPCEQKFREYRELQRVDLDFHPVLVG